MRSFNSTYAALAVPPQDHKLHRGSQCPTEEKSPGQGTPRRVPGLPPRREGGRRLAGAATQGTWMRLRWSKAVCTQPGTSPGSSREPFPLRILQLPRKLRLRAAAVGSAPHSASSRSRQGRMLGPAGRCRCPRGGRPRKPRRASWEPRRRPFQPRPRPRPGPRPARRSAELPGPGVGAGAERQPLGTARAPGAALCGRLSAPACCSGIRAGDATVRGDRCTQALGAKWRTVRGSSGTAETTAREASLCFREAKHRDTPPLPFPKFPQNPTPCSSPVASKYPALEGVSNY